MRQKEWVPIKRVKPSNSLPHKRKRIYVTREIIREASHKNFKKAKELNSFSYFIKSMDPLLKGLGPSILSKIKYRLFSLVRRAFK